MVIVLHCKTSFCKFLVTIQFAHVVKKDSLIKKIILIESMNPVWYDLSAGWFEDKDSEQ